ncbi:RNA polymerase sigma factor [Marinifilum sp. D714]|uniref:RNA polymerase sigma factor n=1 Tax=Marinifilum sp. D714 TaxID=2937523 RepID=UPI0027C4357C|nr:RNA polymerase sigma factor [Marinifilum sp. D714]MDQ2178776.1 RNA polymerase sigma factor [Marinifilum sp. D714]
MKKSVHKNLSDEQLVMFHLQGDQMSIGILYERHFNKVYYKCLSFTKDSSEAYDLVQEIFLRTFSKLHLFRGNSEFSTWLYRITQNFCIEHYRKKFRNQYEVLSSAAYNLEDEGYEPCRLDNISIETIIKSVSETDQLMLKLKYLEGKSIKELQDQFNMGASAVKMRLQRAKQKISKQIKFFNEIM